MKNGQTGFFHCRDGRPIKAGKFLVGLLLLCSLLFQPFELYAQELNKKRLYLVGGGALTGYTVLLTGLNQAWYVNYPKSSFHFINDSREWMQVDKFGHAWTSYVYGLAGVELMKWTGMERKKAIWIGGLAGTLFQTPIEILDGFSAEWGASASDLIANSVGSALVISQELAWDEQRLLFKYSCHLTDYARLRPNLLGNSLPERVLKDYNGQTYWLSASPGSFNPDSFWPDWLCISLGYGANGMLGGYRNWWYDGNGQLIGAYASLPRYRQYYLSLDIDLQKLPVKNPFLKRALKVVNCIKIPAPAFSWSERHGLRFHPLYF